MFQKRLFFLFILLIGIKASAQDTLVLINGRVIPVKSVDLQEYKIAYRKIPKTGSETSDVKKTRLKTIDPERVFSIKYRDGNEFIVYRPDSLDPLEFNVEQMRLFVQGEQDATKYYKNNLNKGVGFIIGGGSGLLGFYGIAGPPLYATIMGSFTPNLSKRLKRQNEMKESKMALDALKVPVSPDLGNGSAGDEAKQSGLLTFEKEKKNYEAAKSRYEKAVKNHDKNISFSDPLLLEKNEYREGYERKARDRKIRNAMLSGLAGFVMVVIGLPIIY